MERSKKSRHVRKIVAIYREGAKCSDMLFKLAKLVLETHTNKRCDDNERK